MKVISGGQTGADLGALVAAKQLGIPTGGWMPRGYLTEAGPCPVLGELYGLQEHPSAAYPPRTRQNVKDSDLTVWVGTPTGRGFQCTRKWAEVYERPFLIDPTPEELREALDTYHVQVLNVAGHRSSHNPASHTTAAQLIHDTFQGLALGSELSHTGVGGKQ